VREITRKIDEQINSVRRELSNLLNIGIITSETTNNKLYYEVNQKFEYYEPLREIFGGGVKKSVKKAADGDVAEESGLDTVGRIDLALYTGQFTRDDSSGVDFLVVGDVNPNALKKYVGELEKQENKELRYAFMTLPEFTYRRQINDRFIVGVLGAKHQVLVDVPGVLSKSTPGSTAGKDKDSKEQKEEK
jgi:hypothetical protein